MRSGCKTPKLRKVKESSVIRRLTDFDELIIREKCELLGCCICQQRKSCEFFQLDSKNNFIYPVCRDCYEKIPEK